MNQWRIYDFPDGGTNPRDGGTPTKYLANFFPKTTWKKLDQEGASLAPPPTLDPPMSEPLVEDVDLIGLLGIEYKHKFWTRMHSSGMRTARLLTVSSMHCARGCVSQHALGRGCVSQHALGRGCLPRGCIPVCNGADTPPVDRHLWKHDLRKFAGSNESRTPSGITVKVDFASIIITNCEGTRKVMFSEACVSHSVYGGIFIWGVVYREGLHPKGGLPPWSKGLHLGWVCRGRGSASRGVCPTPILRFSGGHCSGRYASYWNAFLSSTVIYSRCNISLGFPRHRENGIWIFHFYHPQQ